MINILKFLVTCLSVSLFYSINFMVYHRVLDCFYLVSIILKSPSNVCSALTNCWQLKLLAHVVLLLGIALAIIQVNNDLISIQFHVKTHLFLFSNSVIDSKLLHTIKWFLLFHLIYYNVSYRIEMLTTSRKNLRTCGYIFHQIILKSLNKLATTFSRHLNYFNVL